MNASFSKAVEFVSFPLYFSRRCHTIFWHLSAMPFPVAPFFGISWSSQHLWELFAFHIACCIVSSSLDHTSSLLPPLLQLWVSHIISHVSLVVRSRISGCKPPCIYSLGSCHRNTLHPQIGVHHWLLKIMNHLWKEPKLIGSTKYRGDSITLSIFCYILYIISILERIHTETSMPWEICPRELTKDSPSSFLYYNTSLRTWSTMVDAQMLATHKDMVK